MSNDSIHLLLLRFYLHLTNYNLDRLTSEDAKDALEEAPIVNKPNFKGLVSANDSWIDYLLWVEKFSGFRKPNTRVYVNFDD